MTCKFARPLVSVARARHTVQIEALWYGRRSMAPQFQAYDNVNAAQHQTSFNQLSAEGFTLIALSVYGDPGNALYAAVWAKVPSPPWIAIHNTNATGFQNWINQTVEPQGF